MAHSDFREVSMLRISGLKTKKMFWKDAQMKRIRREKNGFTIVELLVVIMIISMLAVFVVPRMFKGLGKTRREIARAKMAILDNAIGRFNLACGRYPDETQQLGELLDRPEGLEEKWDGPYLKQSDLLDPWGNPYVYREEGEANPGSYDLISYGADGAEGGEGDDEDIYND